MDSLANKNVHEINPVANILETVTDFYHFVLYII